MRTSFLAGVATLALCLSGIPNGAAFAAYTKLYVFGDSLTDAGNVYAVTTQDNPLGAVLADAPAPPYFEGRFSNGYNFADRLSMRLFGAPLTPALGGGTDYAVGGATTGLTNAFIPSNVPIPPTGMLGQYDLYRVEHGGRADPNALYLVYGGSNDLLHLFDTLPPDTAQWPSLAGAVVASATDNLTTIIGGLAQEGARHFLVPDVPDLGLIPQVRGTPLRDFATAASAAFDAALAARLQALAASGLDLHALDVAGLLQRVVSNPGAYGFSDVTDPCYPGTVNGGIPPTPCADPARYLFWDGMHPTANGHALLADFAFDALGDPRRLSEPGGGVLLQTIVLGLAAGWLRCRVSARAGRCRSASGRAGCPPSARGSRL